MNRSKESGFTLIEMLVVVAIVGLLAGVVVVGIGGSRTKARDARRVSDIRALQNYLESNYTATNGYATSSGGSPWTVTAANSKSGVDMNPEKDPSGNDYYYWSPTNQKPRQTYELGTCIEEPGNLDSGSLTTGNCNNLSSVTCPGGTTLHCTTP
ncbi:MAG: type II secretion system protein [Candidatus Magasanikbacteria bacterium]